VLSHLIRRRWPIPVIAIVVVLVVVAVAVMGSANAGGEDEIVIYNGRSHYGDEQVFHDFEDATGIHVVLRGGTGPELYERLRREGDATPADVLVTTDLANLWRAEDAGLLHTTTSPKLRANVPTNLQDPGSEWWALTTRLRIPVVSTKRITQGQVTSYEDLGDPRYRGRTCLRTSNNEYNQSLVADMIAKRGRPATEALLRSWMANNPKILNSDGELLAVIAAGDCDVGLSNHYYLARALLENENFPVTPAWPDQNGAGAHANVSGAGVVRFSDNPRAATKLLEFLTSPKAQKEFTTGGEFAANVNVAPEKHVRDWANVKMDPIDVAHAGPLIPDAIALMLEVGWK
jgi:iron(III) transport system substrate-binding protein